MSAREAANALLDHLMQSFNIKGLAFNQDNECILTIDSKIVVLFYLNEANNALLLNAIVDTVDTNHPQIQKLLYEILCGNFNWALTSGGTLGIDKNTGMLTLCYKYSLPVDSATFMKTLSNLTARVEFWTKRISEIEQGK